MPRPEHTALLALLLKAYNRPVMDFHYFPDVVLIGKTRIEREELLLLLSEGYLQQTHRDNFGRFFTLTEKAKMLLHQSLKGGRKSRKKEGLPAGQGSFLFR
jgi:hypothetical protein